MFSSLTEETERAGDLAKLGIQAAPEAFRAVMEESRRLIHFDILVCQGQLLPSTMIAAQQRLVTAIGDPVQALQCINAIYEPYRQLNAACIQRERIAREQQEYARSVLIPDPSSLN
jgi:hypothetical protein